MIKYDFTVNVAHFIEIAIGIGTIAGIIWKMHVQNRAMLNSIKRRVDYLWKWFCKEHGIIEPDNIDYDDDGGRNRKYK